MLRISGVIWFAYHRPYSKWLLQINNSEYMLRQIFQCGRREVSNQNLTIDINHFLDWQVLFPNFGLEQYHDLHNEC